MSLLLRLTLTYALVLILALSGLGVTLFALLRQGLGEDFDEDMRGLALAYAERALLRPDVVQLEPLPPAPIREDIEEPEVFLLSREGRLLDALVPDSQPPILPGAVLEQTERGETGTFSLSSLQTRPLWYVLLSGEAAPLEKRGVAVPILRLEGGLQPDYLVVVTATDIGLVRVLEDIRNSVALWLGLGILIALGVGYALALYVTLPLRDVLEAAEAVSSGNLKRRVARPERRDELGTLKRRLNAMLERLETLVEAQRRFTADAAHDFRTPLSILKTELELTLRRERPPEEYRATLERLRPQVDALARLAEDLLTLARLEAGFETPMKPFILAEALEGLWPALRKSAEQKGLILNLQVPYSLRVQGDRAGIARAVSNLSANAVQHTPSGEVGVRAWLEENWVTLEVWDTGPGVPLELRPRLLERFSKGQRSGGSGLGLAIVAEVARQHGTTLTLEDRAGGGSSFKLRLPAADGGRESPTALEH